MRFIALSKLVKQERGIRKRCVVGRWPGTSSEVLTARLATLHGEGEVETDLISGLDHA